MTLGRHGDRVGGSVPVLGEDQVGTTCSSETATRCGPSGRFRIYLVENARDAEPLRLPSRTGPEPRSEEASTNWL